MNARFCHVAELRGCCLKIALQEYSDGMSDSSQANLYANYNDFSSAPARSFQQSPAPIPNPAAKIIGMLLEIDSAKLLVLMKSPESLSTKVEEAFQLLKNSKARVSGQDVLHSNFLSSEVAELRGCCLKIALQEYSDGMSDSSQETGGQTCHQCRII